MIEALGLVQRGAVGDLAGLGVRLVLQEDRHRHMAGLRLDGALHLMGLGVLRRILLQVERHAGAAGGRLGGVERLQRVGAKPVGRPQGRRLGARPSRGDLDPVGTMKAE